MDDIKHSVETPFSHIKMKILYSIIINILLSGALLYYFMFDFKKVIRPSLFITLILVIFLVYRYYTIKSYLKKNPTFFSNGISTNKPLSINKDLFKKPKDHFSFLIMFDLYIKDYKYKYGKIKNILRKGYGRKVCPEINLDKNVNNMVISFMLENGEYKTVQLNDIPINKYTNICIQVNNNTVEIYRDGLLVNAYAFGARPLFNFSDLNLFMDGGFKGQLSNLHYSSEYHNALQVRSKSGRMKGRLNFKSNFSSSSFDCN